MMKAELIDKYIRNEMDDREKDLFSSRLGSDAELKAAFELTRDIALFIQETEVIQLRNQLDDIHDDLFGDEKPKIITLRWIKTAAAVVAITLATTLYMWSNRSVSSQELISGYYAPYESTMRVRSSGQTDNIIANAMKAYDQKDYKKAAELFDQVLLENGEKPLLNLYSGIAHMETGQFQKAETMFRSILREEKNNPYIEHAEWYMAFNYLKNQQIEEAKTLFGQIASDEDNYYQQKAKTLNRKLNRIKK